VLKCLVKTFFQLQPTCQTEMARAVRMALWDFKAGAPLTTVCDAEVTTICSKVCTTAIAQPRHSTV
jgi:Golgi apparatus protein 1